MFRWLRDLLSGGFEGRSPQWREVRNAYVRQHPTCAVCGGDEDIEAHHVRPFHLEPALELDPNNLITLCRPHHYLVGHLMDWRSFNRDVRLDAAVWLQKIRTRP